MSKKVEEHLKEALENIREDRKVTRELLDDAIKFVAKDEARHQQIGLTLAKYVETLQRSNEQLVKVIGIMSKKDATQGLGAIDKDQLFDLIAEDNNVDNKNK